MNTLHLLIYVGNNEKESVRNSILPLIWRMLVLIRRGLLQSVYSRQNHPISQFTILFDGQQEKTTMNRKVSYSFPGAIH